MWEIVWKYSAVFFFSMLKFIAGPIIGEAEELHFIITGLLTSAGMMTAVLLVSFLGDRIKQLFKTKKGKKKKIKKKYRKILKVWSKYGVFGLAFLTPLVLTPIGGTLVGTALGAPQKKLISYMTISSLFWGIVLSFLVMEFHHLFERYL